MPFPVELSPRQRQKGPIVFSPERHGEALNLRLNETSEIVIATIPKGQTGSAKQSFEIFSVQSGDFFLRLQNSKRARSCLARTQNGVHKEEMDCGTIGKAKGSCCHSIDPITP